MVDLAPVKRESPRPESTWNRARALAALAGAVACLGAAPANAQATAPPATPAPQRAPDETTAVATDDSTGEALPFPGPRLPYRPWRVFDPFLSLREALVVPSIFDARPLGSPTGQLGFGLAFGETLTTQRGPLFIRGRAELGARLIDGRHVMLTLGQYGYGAGVVLGPIELEARLGISLLDIHLGKGEWGVGFLSPRVGVGLSFVTSRLRVGAVAFSEYSWRWTAAGDNLRVSGIVLEIASGRTAKGLPARYELR